MSKSKNTGMVRNLDSLGRIVIPIELRRSLEVEIGDSLEYFIDEPNRRILLRKYRAMECFFCFSGDRLTYFKNYFVCSSCLREVSGIDAEKKQDMSHQILTHSEQAATTEISAGAIGKNTRSNDMLQRLTNVMESYPAATQKKWAELLGVTQGRVSQLVQKLKNSSGSHEKM